MPSAQSVNKTFTIVARDDSKTATEIAGANRYETAAKIALQTYPSGSNGAIVCAGGNYPDSLAASSLAGLLDYPIVTTEKDALSDATRSAIERLSSGKQNFKVLVVGGSAAVSDATEAALAAMAGVNSLERLEGANRYLTQMAVYDYGRRLDVQAETGRQWGNSFIIATGSSFADALSIAPYAAKMRAPVFLVDSSAGFIQRVEGALNSSAIRGRNMTAIIVGGTAVVSEDIRARVAELAEPARIERLAGETRYETSRAIAEYCVRTLPYEFTYDGTAFTTGRNFADALAGGVMQSKRGSLIVLVDPGALAGAELVAANNQFVFDIFYLGGTSAVPQDLRDQINSMIGTG